MPRTALQIATALASVVLACGALLVLMLWTLARQERADVGVTRLDHAKHTAHRIEAQLREQYIHQAHSIIERTLGHVGHYTHAVGEARAAITQLAALASPADAGDVQRLSKLAARSDKHFREKILPAIRAGRAKELVSLHTLAEATVTEATAINARLSAALAQRSTLARHSAAALRRQTRTMALVCFAATFTAALLLAVAITRRIGRRIVAVRDGARALSRGVLDARVSLGGSDEFAELAETFNDMAASLDTHQRDLLRAERLASIGKVAAGVAHEINNPLGVILGYVHLLRRRAREDQHESLEIIEHEVKLCQRIVEGLLDLARPSALDLETVDVCTLADELVTRLREGGRLGNVEVTVHDDVSSVQIDADADKLEQLLTNIVVNAAQSAAARVDISVARDDDVAVITVSDDGPGMSDEVRARALDPFFSTKRDGVGLGLAVVSAIVEAHGGELQIHCPRDGGTRVRVRLPQRARGSR
ncbi:MAG: HAMP domain-containing protein [Myxococcales bacterium]|nr:HAMP domain-containing protein [Myxococcales bacterium]